MTTSVDINFRGITTTATPVNAAHSYNTCAQTDEQFVRAHADDLLRFCFARLGDMNSAEEAFTDIFVEALVHGGEHTGDSSEDTLFTLANRICDARTKSL